MNLRLEDLQFEGLKIYQNPNGYCFTSDAVLLANYCKFLPGAKVVEFCAGTGVISILLTKKQRPSVIHAFEVMKSPFEILEKNIELNNLQKKIVPHHEKLENSAKILGVGYADVVVCNPPYLESEIEKSESEIDVATKEISTNLESVIKSAAKVLKFGGKFFMVHRTDRLVDALCLMRKYKLEPKKLKIIYPKIDREPVVFLCEAMSGGKAGLRVSKITFADELNKSSDKTAD